LLNVQVNVNTWLWSTVFHTRDTDFTEVFDLLNLHRVILNAAYSSHVQLLFQVLVSLSRAITHVHHHICWCCASSL